MLDHDIIIAALRNANPELAFIADYLKEENERKSKSGGLVRTVDFLVYGFY